MKYQVLRFHKHAKGMLTKITSEETNFISFSDAKEFYNSIAIKNQGEIVGLIGIENDEIKWFNYYFRGLKTCTSK